MKTPKAPQLQSDTLQDSTELKSIFSPNKASPNNTQYNNVIKLSPKKTKQTQFNCIMTGVNPERTHGTGIWGNRRVVMGIRVDENLKKEATRVLKLIYGSTCRGIEAYLAGIVATYYSQGIHGVNPSNTIDIRIDNLNVQRNLKTRRRLIVEEETEIKEIVEPVKPKTTKFVDFSQLPLEELQSRYNIAKKRADVVKIQFLAHELRRRCVLLLGKSLRLLI